VVAALLLAAVAAAAGGYAVQRLTGPAAAARVTGHALVATQPSPPPLLSEAGPAGVPPPPPQSLGAHQLVVPILLYHYIRVDRKASDVVGFNLSVTPEHFAEQMALLKATGAHTVTPADLVAALRGGPPLPPRPVILTFDDGYDDFYSNALPVLQREGLRAISYVVSGFVGRPGYMSADEVRSVVAAGDVVGDHTINHVALAHITPAAAQAEITVSRAQLQALTGTPVDDFAYPYGDWDPLVARLVEQAGFHDAVTTDLGNLHDLAQLFTLRRIRIGGTDTLASFAEKAGVPLVPLPPPPPPGATVAASPSPARPPAATNAATATPMPQPSPSPPPSAATADLVQPDRRAA
jgi:peptidoglycan/xylan/chitin deacetylase (PgdA/CDA1 family)